MIVVHFSGVSEKKMDVSKNWECIVHSVAKICARIYSVFKLFDNERVDVLKFDIINIETGSIWLILLKYYIYIEIIYHYEFLFEHKYYN